MARIHHHPAMTTIIMMAQARLLEIPGMVKETVMEKVTEKNKKYLLQENMNIYKDYIQEIEERKNQGLHPKPIDDAALLSEIIAQIPKWLVILEDYYSKHDLFHSHSLHLALFMQHEPFGLRYLRMPLSSQHKSLLFKLIKQFVNKNLNKFCLRNPRNVNQNCRPQEEV